MQLLRNLRYMAQVMGRLGGDQPRECPICGAGGRFRAFGHPPRYDARCPGCQSLERHRLLYLAMQERGLVPDGSRILHFAPEKPIAAVLKKRDVVYHTADKEPGRADVVVDIEAIALPDDSYDVVICNHVLEHVDDRAALAEIRRILAPGGRLIAMVPLIEGWDESYENPAVATPADRELNFGQDNHVRYYGRDFRERIRAAGFELSEYVASGEASARYGLTRGERVFIGAA